MPRSFSALPSPFVGSLPSHIYSRWQSARSYSTAGCTGWSRWASRPCGLRPRCRRLRRSSRRPCGSPGSWSRTQSPRACPRAPWRACTRSPGWASCWWWRSRWASGRWWAQGGCQGWGGRPGARPGRCRSGWRWSWEPLAGPPCGGGAAARARRRRPACDAPTLSRPPASWSQTVWICRWGRVSAPGMSTAAAWWEARRKLSTLSASLVSFLFATGAHEEGGGTSHQWPREALARAHAASFTSLISYYFPPLAVVFSSELSCRHFRGVEN